MVAVFNKELLSWYLITLKLRETVDQNISKSGPSTPSNPPTTIPTLLIPSQFQIPLLTNGESHHDRETIPDQNPNPKLNQEPKEETLIVPVEPAPTQIREIGTAQSLPIPIPRSPRDTWVVFIRQKLQKARDEEDKNLWSKLSIPGTEISAGCGREVVCAANGVDWTVPSWKKEAERNGATQVACSASCPTV